MQMQTSSTLKLHIETDTSKPSIALMIFDALLSGSAFYGFGGAFCDLFDIKPNEFLLLLTAVASCVVLLLPLRKTWFTKLVPVASAIIVTALAFENFANGFILTSNSVLDTIGRRFARIIPHIQTLSNDNSHSKTAISVFVIVTALFLSYSVAYSIKHADTLFPLILSLLTTAGCIVLEVSPSLKYIFSAMFYTLGIAFKKISGNKGAMTRLCVCIAVCIPITAVMSQVDMQNSEHFFQNIKSSICNKTNYLRYSKSSVMPEGEFSSLGSFEPTGQKLLEVKMSTPQSMYLKGFVGETFNGNGWEKIESSLIYNSADLFYQLHEKKFFSQSQLSLASNSTDPTNLIAVRNLGASRKYIYHPYELNFSENDLPDKSSLSDGHIRTIGFNGQSEYVLNCVKNPVKRYPEILETISKNDSYQNLEKHYRKFVYDTYLDIPDEDRSIISSLLGGREENDTRYGYSQAQQKILSRLSTQVTYSTNISIDNSSDFLYQFLLKNRKGYSVHYATSATLMFRYLGIPARYVEGFLVTPNDVQNAHSDSTFSIDDTHFHAWTEFYRDGIGWIPFETTPPYLNVMEKAEEIAVLPENSYETGNEPQREHESQRITDSPRVITIDCKALINALLAVILTGLSALVFTFFLRRLRLRKKLKLFAGADNKTSVLLTFQHIVTLLSAANFMQNENELYIDSSALYKNTDSLSSDIKTALCIYQKAKFSSHEISTHEKQLVLTLLDNVESKIKKRVSTPKSLYYRYFRCICR